MTLNYLSLGIGGYLKIQKEVTFGTAATGSMITLPIDSDSVMNYNIKAIENATQIGDRIKQKPDKGQKVVKGTVKVNAYPTLIGELMHIFLGTAGTTGKKHAWFAPMTGQRVNTSSTIEQALGDQNATDFVGCMINSFKISGDNSNNAKCELEIVGKDYTEGITPSTSLTIPTVLPYRWSHCSVKITPYGGSEESILATNYDFTLNLNYDMERFKVGSDTIYQPTFNSAPAITMSFESEAFKEHKDWALGYTDLKVVMEFTHTSLVSGDPYVLKIEVPCARINPEFNFANTNDRMNATLELVGDYGGTVEDGGATIHLCQISVTDGTVAYA